MKNLIVIKGILPSSYGHWSTIPDGRAQFTTGEVMSNHPHANLKKKFSDVSGIKNLVVHGSEIDHISDGRYGIHGRKIEHGNLNNLSSEIKMMIDESKRIHHSTTDDFPTSTIDFEKSSLKTKIYMDGSHVLVVIKDANNCPVMCSMEPYNSLQKSIQKAIKMSADYITHEHHRASMAIHGQTKLSHSPDHIPFNMSPLEYWPVHDHRIFFRSIPTVKNMFDNEEDSDNAEF